jgi:hypothetical protein
MERWIRMLRYHIVTALIGLGVAVGAMLLAQPDTGHGASFLPICAEEDGSDIDGLCMWVDPDTGDGYINPTPEERFDYGN